MSIKFNYCLVKILFQIIQSILINKSIWNRRSSNELWVFNVFSKSDLYFILAIINWSYNSFCFVLPFFPSASWPLSFLSLFFLFLRPCLIHARMPDWGKAFVHGHTFLHSWTHFLAFMEWADDIGSGPAAWSYVPVQSSSCSLRVFYRTSVVGKDTYWIPLNTIQFTSTAA